MSAFWIITTLLILSLSILIIRRIRTARRSESHDRGTFQPPPPDPRVLIIRGFDFYVRLKPDNKAEMLDNIKTLVGGRGTIYDEANYAVVLWDDFRPPEALFAQLSKQLHTEVIWLAFQKQVDAFAYQRWNDGERVRRLTFGCYEEERTWEEVDGSPEPWEARVIFNQTELEERVLDMAPDEERELRAIWREQRLQVGSQEPNIDGRNVANAVAIEYRLPGWD